MWSPTAKLRIAACTTVLGCYSVAEAESRYWVGPASALWSDPTNWSATPGGPGGAGVPQEGDAAVAPSGINARFDYVYSQPGIGLQSLSSPVLIQQSDPGSRLVGINSLILPRFQFTGDGVGRYLQSAGTVVLNMGMELGHSPLTSQNIQGFYTLSGNATLSVGTSMIIANGTYTQTGGVSSIGQNIELGGFGKSGGVAMSGGTLTVGGAFSQIVGASTFSGGQTSIGGFLAIGLGSVTLSGGNLSVGSIDVAAFFGGEQMIQNGGALVAAEQVRVASGGFYRYSGGSFSAGPLDIAGQFLMSPGGDKVARTRGITTTGAGKMDIADNGAIVDYDPSAGSPIASIRSQIVTAYNNGSWTGGGITSSLANATTHGVGYAEASVVSSIPSIFGDVDDTTVLIRLTRYGDADLNGLVNLDDFNRLAANFGSTNAVWSQADFTYDGNVNLEDFNRLAANFGLNAAGPEVTPQDWAALASAVPEPATGVVCGLLLCAAVARRRRPIMNGAAASTRTTLG